MLGFPPIPLRAGCAAGQTDRELEDRVAWRPSGVSIPSALRAAVSPEDVCNSYFCVLGENKQKKALAKAEPTPNPGTGAEVSCAASIKLCAASPPVD